MARTAVTPVALLVNQGVNVANGTVGVALDPANGHTIATDGRTKRFLIHVKNTTASIKNITVKAGSNNPPAYHGAQGDLVAALAANTGEQIFSVESSRFEQVDGSISIDVAASMTGTIAVYKVPAEL